MKRTRAEKIDEILADFASRIVVKEYALREADTKSVYERTQIIHGCYQLYRTTIRRILRVSRKTEREP